MTFFFFFLSRLFFLLEKVQSSALPNVSRTVGHCSVVGRMVCGLAVRSGLVVLLVPWTWNWGMSDEMLQPNRHRNHNHHRNRLRRILSPITKMDHHIMTVSVVY